MIIKSLKLTNFRCHSSYIFEANKNTSLILGKNGCGKTSVLEAIYICMRGKSFRATDNDILKKGEEYYKIELFFENGEKEVVLYDGKDKTYLISDKKSKRIPAKNKYPVVLFLPDDLHIFKTSPTKIRDFFDNIIEGCYPEYSSILSKYNKALRQRNNLLKQDKIISSDELFSWNIILAKYGIEIREYRNKIIKKINEKITDIYRSIAENNDTTEIKYNILGNNISESEYLVELENNLDKDKILGHTSYGVHRDSFDFILNNKSASTSASRGESRSIILALKFIEAELIYEKTHKKPVVLLDDVFSELDSKRQKALTTNFKENQVIITSIKKPS